MEQNAFQDAVHTLIRERLAVPAGQDLADAGIQISYTELVQGRAEEWRERRSEQEASHWGADSAPPGPRYTELAAIQVPRPRKAEVLKFVREGSQRVRNCTCNRGEIACGDWDGFGTTTCERWVECTQCPQETGRTCWSCNGERKVPCPHCRGTGQRPCTRCDRRGQVRHAACNGTGAMTVWLQATLVRTPEVERFLLPRRTAT